MSVAPTTRMKKYKENKASKQPELQGNEWSMHEI